jgi:hypothetical protein
MDLRVVINVNLPGTDRIRSRPPDADKAGDQIIIRETERTLRDFFLIPQRDSQVAAIAFGCRRKPEVLDTAPDGSVTVEV